MGNEMGNNNTSEFREEDNRSPETEGKAQEQVHSNNDLKEENHVAAQTPDQSKDYHEKETELASDYSKAAPDHTNGKEEDNISPETEGKEQEPVHVFISTPESKDDHEKVNELAFDDTKAAAAEDTNEKDEKEEEIVNTTSVVIALEHDPECEDSAEHESTQVEDDQSEQENTNSAKQIEEIGSLVDISESNVDFNAKQKTYESDNNSEESVLVPSTILDTAETTDCLMNEAEPQEDTRLSDEKLLQVENEDTKAKIETKNDGDMDSNGTNSFESEEVHTDDTLCSDLDVSMPVDKCIILTEEKKVIAKESENGDSKNDANESESEVEEATNSLTGPNCKNDENGDPTVAAHEASSNGNLQVEEIKVTEESCNQNKASEELLKESEAKIMMVHWHHSLAATQNGNEKGYSGSVSTEGRSALVPELVDLTTKLSITNGIYIKKESEDFESEEEEPEKEQSFEMEVKTEAPVSDEVCKPCFPAFLLESLDEEQKITMECEDTRVREESPSEVKLESSSELLGAVSSPFTATNTSIETLVPAVELPIKKHEEAEAGAVLLDASEIGEMLIETKSSASENLFSKDGVEAQEDVTSASNGLVPESSTMIEKTPLIETVTEAELPASGYAEQSNERSEKVETSMSERVVNEEQEIMANFSIESNPDSFNACTEMRESPSFAIESSSELLGTVVSPFHVTKTSMETLIAEVELSIEKHEEAEARAVLHDASEITETLTETKSSVSENHSSEKHQEFKSTSVSRDDVEEQDDVTSSSNGLVLESLTVIEKTQLVQTATEAELPASGYAEQSNEQSERVEISMSERVGNEEHESTGRFSIESIPDSFNARAEMRKSPSFGIDLRIEARNEESDHTPLLHQNMNTNEDDVCLQTSLQQLLKDQPLPPEEKVITTLERSDSEKSRTPLFEQQDSAEKDSTNTKKSPSSSKMTSKSKEKHKRKSSLFTNCMCCTTVMN